MKTYFYFNLIKMKTYYNETKTKCVWYNRYEKTWVLQTLDTEGNQVGNADYCHNRNTAFNWLARENLNSN